MFTLDVLDYLTELEDHLESRLDRAERRMARKEVRRLVEDLAFRFAFMDGRVMPEEVDYVRALECLKRPEQVAEVLVARRKVAYRRRKVRGRVTRFAVLGAVLLLGLVFAQFVASEDGQVVLDVGYAVGGTDGELGEGVDTFTFNVSERSDRLLFTGSAALTSGNVTVTLLDPSGDQAFVHTFRPKQGNYERAQLLDPEAGTWTVDVVKEDASGIVEFWAQTSRQAG